MTFNIISSKDLIHNWKIIAIEEAGLEIEDGDRGKNYPKKHELQKNGYCPFLNNKNVIGDKINLEDVDFISYEKDQMLRKGKVRVNDIIMTTRGSVGNIGLFTEDLPYDFARINSGMVIIRNNEDLFDLNFLYQLLKSPIMKEQYKNLSTGTAQPQLPIKDIKKLKLIVPPIDEQRSISRLLTSLDEKIEHNYEINNTLEQIAQSIFKHWFVDFEFPNENGEPYKSSGGKFVESEIGMIPEGWEIRELGSILNLVKNNTKAGNHLVNLPYVPIDVIPMKKMGLEKHKEWTEAKSSLIMFEKNDILLGAMRVYFHRVCIAPEKGVTRTTTFVLRPKKSMDLSYILLLLFQESTIAFANSTSKGTTIPYAVWENGLEKMKIALPPIYLRDLFHQKVWSMIEKIRDTIYEQQTLSEIKDSLLSKLMSGEIRIPEAEEAVESCLQKNN